MWKSVEKIGEYKKWHVYVIYDCLDFFYDHLLPGGRIPLDAAKAFCQFAGDEVLEDIATSGVLYDWYNDTSMYVLKTINNGTTYLVTNGTIPEHSN